MFKKAISTIFISIFSVMAFTQMTMAEDVLEKNCMLLTEKCPYVALQKRDMQKFYRFLNAQLREDFKKNPEVVKKLMKAIPHQDPLAVEVPVLLDGKPYLNENRTQKIFFFRYPNFGIRFRVVYESNLPDAKISGFWIMKIDPKSQQ